MNNQQYDVAISIIIITYNSKGYLSKCLKSLELNNNREFFEVVVIDNNSTESILDIINESKCPLFFIQNNKNVGFARACNEGIKSAKGKYIFLLNPDTELLNTSLDIFFDFMEKKENELVWCVGAQLYDEYKTPSKSYGHFPNLFDIIFEQFGIKGLLLKIPKLRQLIKHKIINQNREVPFVMGCDMFIRKSVLNEIGIFNERFFLNYEETELSWRANKAGFKSVILPKAKILHYSGRSFTDLKSYLSYLWYGQLLFFKLTQRHSIFIIAKSIHLLGTVLRLIFKFDKFYWNHFKNILSI
jgi:GT2 family glycosyltransferase